MAEESVQRRLAAIFAADVAGYSRLVSADEDGTLSAFRSHFTEFIEPTFAEHNGRLFKTMGDGLFAEFSSVVEAVQCAVTIQHGMSQRNSDALEDRRIEFRIGINLGDVVVQDEDVFGDGVNVAARLEGLAEPGGICISRSARDQIRDKLEYGLEDWGEIEVKNIPRPVRVFRVLTDVQDAGKIITKPPNNRRKFGPVATALLLSAVIAAVGFVWWQPWETFVEAASLDKMAFPLPDKPSIAVLPFASTSDDKTIDLLADGITEDVITDLSKISSLFVIGHNSTSTYKGKLADARKVAEAFGVRHVLFGNIRYANKKLRVGVKLVDAIRGRQLWAEHFDRDLSDIFAVQSDVTRRVVKTLAVTLSANEAERLYQRHTTNIEAYETFLRARKTVLTPDKENVEIAEKLFERVIDLDPKFAGGYAGLALNYSMKARFRYGTDPKEDRKLSLELAQKAVDVDKKFSWSYIALGSAHLAHRNPDAAVASVQQALIIQPNGYEENLWTGFYAHFAGQSAVAVEHLERANRISPTENVRNLSFRAMAYFMNGNYSKSVNLWRRRLRKHSAGNPISYVFLAAALVLIDKPDEAAVVVAKYRDLNPGFRLSNWRYIDFYKSAENRKRLYEAAKKAGMPE